MLNQISSKDKSLKYLSFVVMILTGIFLLSACATQSASADQPQRVVAQPTSASFTSNTAGSSSSGVSFAKDVMPILQNACIKCHGGDKTEKGLDMTTYTALMAGSERGAVVVPGDAQNSSFIHLLLNGKMPKRGQKLSDSQIQILTDWVNAGALNN